MTGQTFGYVRVSSLDQNTIGRLDGEELDRVFMDRVSGKDNRPQLDALIDFARDGDTVLVHSMDRMARNLGDLRAVVRRLTDKKVRVRFVKENLTFTGEDTAMATSPTTIVGLGTSAGANALEGKPALDGTDAAAAAAGLLPICKGGIYKWLGKGVAENSIRGWRLGEPIENLTKAGNSPAWSTVRSRYSKNAANEAIDGEYSAANSPAWEQVSRPCMIRSACQWSSTTSSRDTKAAGTHCPILNLSGLGSMPLLTVSDSTQDPRRDSR